MTPKLVDTNEFAAQNRIKPATLHSAYHRQGHYFGVRPIKQPNKRLLWPSRNDARQDG